jgi:hypothetical protein
MLSVPGSEYFSGKLSPETTWFGGLANLTLEKMGKVKKKKY